MSPRLWICLGALSAAIAVGMGAYHAHGLERTLKDREMDAERMGTMMRDFEVGVHYQLFHAVGLILVGLVEWRAASRWFCAAGGFFIAGTCLFSGCLYWMVLGGGHQPWFLIPSGGMAFILGWVMLAIGALAARESKS